MKCVYLFTAARNAQYDTYIKHYDGSLESGDKFHRRESRHSKENRCVRAVVFGASAKVAQWAAATVNRDQSNLHRLNQSVAARREVRTTVRRDRVTCISAVAARRTPRGPDGRRRLVCPNIENVLVAQ
ncbi:hypothetical protein EVAR_26505_1 [Eumeta japonica]|uniref:Uncharacterized protein n=1 Tax=Eumeta variegata TaxID=151549 RepID=A0A4C1VBD2_EUMVA|nr:hypothetical protein EVAR_26505_1 [Eumeta japonica]